MESIQLFDHESEYQAYVENNMPLPNMCYVEESINVYYNRPRKPNVLSLSVNSLEYLGTGGSSTVTVSSTNSNWTASTEDSWLTVSPTTGSSGNTVVTITAQRATEDREGTVSFTDGVSTRTVNVSQTGEVPYEERYFTTEVLTDGTLSFRNKTGITVEYRINGGEWTTYTTTINGTRINVSSGDVVEWRGTNASYATSHKNSGNFCTTLVSIADGTIKVLRQGDVQI